jgi:DNA repair protein RAD16
MPTSLNCSPECARAVSTKVNKEVVGTYASPLANHIDLVTKKNTDNKQLVCMLCNEPPEDAIAATCRHVFCRECCVQYIETFSSLETDDKAPRCPSCYANFNVDLTQPAMDTGGAGEGAYAGFSKTSIVNRIDMNNWRSSTKIEALVEELSKLRTEDKTIKSIVFSQFVNFLDLVYWRLSRAGFYCIRLDGTMSLQQRDAAIKQFMTNPSCTVFLISLKAGGVALNLTEASRVFIWLVLLFCVRVFVLLTDLQFCVT